MAQKNEYEPNKYNGGNNFVKSLTKKYDIQYSPATQKRSSHLHQIPPNPKPIDNRILFKSHPQSTRDRESENSDADIEPEICSKPESIKRECLNYFENINGCLTNLMNFKNALCDEFRANSEISNMLVKVFKDVTPVISAYKIITENIKQIKSKKSDFYLYEILLDPVICSLLKVYRPFLNDYAVNAKTIGNFYRENQDCIRVCDDARKHHGLSDTVNMDNCLYTVFNSLFSLELMFDRYRTCFDETSFQHSKAFEAKMVISNLLSSINTGNDQIKFLEAQKELRLLSHKSEKTRINTIFIHKGIVTKYARRDDKPLSRQLVLFSDCLFVTYLPSSLTGTSRVRHELSIESMQLSEIDDLNNKDLSNMKWGLNITAKEAVQDFCFDSEQTLQIWKEKLLSVIKNEDVAIKSSIKDRRSTIRDTSTENLDWIGNKAPRWQNDSASGYCNGYNCSQKFSTATRRHHCRADGLLYCVSCSCQKIKLSFERSMLSRVCQLCYNILSLHQSNATLWSESKIQLNIVFDRINHTGKKCGWLMVRKHIGTKNAFQSEVNYYCVIDRIDPFLSLHEKPEDKTRADGVIFLAMVIKTAKEQSSFYKNLSVKQFTMEYEEQLGNDMYLMTARNTDECQSWVDCLRNRILFTKDGTV